jgi:hypothetical protein
MRKKKIKFYFIGTMRLGRRTTHFVTDDSVVSMYFLFFLLLIKDIIFYRKTLWKCEYG